MIVRYDFFFPPEFGRRSSGWSRVAVKPVQARGETTKRFTSLSDSKDRDLLIQLPSSFSFRFPSAASSFKYLITTLQARNASAFNEPPLLFVSSRNAGSARDSSSPVDRLTILCYYAVNFNALYVPSISQPYSFRWRSLRLEILSFYCAIVGREANGPMSRMLVKMPESMVLRSMSTAMSRSFGGDRDPVR